MLEIALGMKAVQNTATEHPLVAIMANDFLNSRDGMDEDEFLTVLARFALAVSAMAIAQTVELCLDEDEQNLLAITVNELMEIEDLGKE
jgi:hypothetical protein